MGDDVRCGVVECINERCMYRVGKDAASVDEARAAAIAAHNRIASLATLGAEVEKAERHWTSDHMINEGRFVVDVYESLERHRSRTGENR